MLIKKHLKKSFIISFIVLIILFFSGCVNGVDFVTSKSNFNEYKEKISTVLKNYDLRIHLYSMNEDTMTADMQVFLQDAQKVYLEFTNQAMPEIGEESGREVFILSYYVDEIEKIDLNLFCDLVNAVSGKKITKNYCADFLNSPNINYDNYGESKTTLKKDFLNFGEDWMIALYFCQDNYELYFGGLTKNGTL